MQVVDGSRGGGQLVRAAVTLAAISGDAVRVVDARSTRDPPGLKAQHVAAIAAAARICNAQIEGVRVGATDFEFDPGTPHGGEYEVDIGTAGSIMLVFDCVLPIAATMDAPVSLTVSGGTDVRWAPTLDFYRHVKLPLLRDAGLDASVTVDQRGFYPAGGGRATLHVEPSTLTPIERSDRGALERVQVRSTAARSLADAEVADRQAEVARQHLPNAVDVETTIEYVETRSPGSVLDIVAEFERSRAGFSSLGKRGKSAAAVATDAVADFAAFRVSDAAVDRHLADQLLPFVALAGGDLSAPVATNHVETHAAIIQQFGHDVSVDRDDGVRLTGRPPTNVDVVEPDERSAD